MTPAGKVRPGGLGGVTTQCNSEFSNGFTVTHADNPECSLGFGLETHLTRETVSLRNEANVA